MRMGGPFRTHPHFEPLFFVGREIKNNSIHLLQEESSPKEPHLGGLTGIERLIPKIRNVFQRTLSVFHTTMFLQKPLHPAGLLTNREETLWRDRKAKNNQ